MVNTTLIHSSDLQDTSPQKEPKALIRVLFIDDNKPDNYLIKAFIKLDAAPVKPHFEVSTIHALEYLKTLSKSDFPEIIFVDINMPSKNGFEFIEDFSQIFPNSDTTIYIMSSYLHPSDEEKIKHYNIKTYIEKPVTTKFLAQIAKSR